MPGGEDPQSSNIKKPKKAPTAKAVARVNLEAHRPAAASRKAVAAGSAKPAPKAAASAKPERPTARGSAAPPSAAPAASHEGHGHGHGHKATVTVTVTDQQPARRVEGPSHACAARGRVPDAEMARAAMPAACWRARAT